MFVEIYILVHETWFLQVKAMGAHSPRGKPSSNASELLDEPQSNLLLTPVWNPLTKLLSLPGLNEWT